VESALVVEVCVEIGVGTSKLAATDAKEEGQEQ